MKVKLFVVSEKEIEKIEDKINGWLKTQCKICRIEIKYIKQSEVEDTWGHVNSLISIWYA